MAHGQNRADLDDLAEVRCLLERYGYPLLADSLAQLMASHGRLTASVEGLLIENAGLRVRLAAQLASLDGNGAGDEPAREKR